MVVVRIVRLTQLRIISCGVRVSCRWRVLGMCNGMMVMGVLLVLLVVIVVVVAVSVQHQLIMRIVVRSLAFHQNVLPIHSGLSRGSGRGAWTCIEIWIAISCGTVDLAGIRQVEIVDALGQGHRICAGVILARPLPGIKYYYCFCFLEDRTDRTKLCSNPLSDRDL